MTEVAPPSMFRGHQFYRSPLNDRIATQIYANQAVGVLERWLLSLLDAAFFVHFAIVIPALHSRPSERNQISHTHSDRCGTDSNLIKVYSSDPRGCQGGF